MTRLRRLGLSWHIFWAWPWPGRDWIVWGIVGTLKYRKYQDNLAVWNLLGAPADPAGPAEVVARSAVRSPTSHAGQEDVSYTNSLK